MSETCVVVIGMGYVGIPCAALFADVPGFRVMGVQRRSRRSGWKIDALNAGRCPFGGDEPGLEELIRRVVLEKRTFQVTDDISVCSEADAILIDVQTPVDGDKVPQYESLREASADICAEVRLSWWSPPWLLERPSMWCCPFLSGNLE